MTWWLPWHPDWYFNAGALLLAVLLDAVFPEPPNSIHPVAWMGKVISALERLAENLGNFGAFTVGALMAVAVPALFGCVAWFAVLGLLALGDIAFLIGAAILMKTTFAVRGLARAARETQAQYRGRRDSDGSLQPARSGQPRRF